VKITNDLNLPQPIMAAVMNDPYDDGGADISVTRLISPPRQVALLKGGSGYLSEDVSDRMYALLGQSVHTILERAPEDESIVMKEDRVFADIRGWRVSGQVDLVYRDGDELVLADYKVMSVWEGMNGINDDKVDQLNFLAALLRMNGIIVSRLEIVGLYRDWSKTKAKHGQHPARQVEVFQVEAWAAVSQDAELINRVLRHQKAQGGDLPECTADERWERPTQYAVMKDGRKSALRVVGSEEDALSWAVWKGLMAEGEPLPPGHRIEVRPGECVRCENYCAAALICNQWMAMNV